LAQRIFVYDTGSTDTTLDLVRGIQSDKIEVVCKHSAGGRELTAYRNEMIERTDTEWFMLVDGDEIYPAHDIGRIADELGRVAPTVHRIVVDRRHLVRSFNFISPVDRLGRIFRTRHIRIKKDYPYQTPCLREDPDMPLHHFSMQFPEDIFFFHCHYLVRSSRDMELGRFRGWRKPPFPARPYFGPWPETLQPQGVASRMTPTILARCLSLNARILWARRFRVA
jgi:glycosyltransferase involved in cell wall biosynthesis